MFYLMDECLDADVVCMNSGDGGVDVVEVPEVIYQLWIMLYISEVSSGGAGSVSIWISRIGGAQRYQGAC